MVSNLKILIKSNLKTFISILLLTMLGVGFLTGMKSTTPNLRNVVLKYYKEHNFYDISLSSSIGFTKEELYEIGLINEIDLITGTYRQDVLVNKDSDEFVLRINSYKDEKINNLDLIEGTFPNKSSEIVIQSRLKEELNYNIGDYIEFNSPSIKNNKYKIVGVVNSPLYLSNNIGETNLLSGKVNYYSYIDIEDFKKDYYDDAYIKVKDNKKIDEVKEKIVHEGDKIISKRYENTIDTLTTTIEEKQKELDSKKEELKEKLDDYQKQIDNAELTLQGLDKSIPSFDEATKILNEKKKNLNTLKSKLDAAKQEINVGEAEYNAAKKEYDEAYNSYIQMGVDSNVSYYREEINRLKRENERLQASLNNTSDEAEKNTIRNKIAENEKEIASNESLLSFAEIYSNGALTSLNLAQKKLNDAKSELDRAKREYDLANNEYLKLKNELDSISVEKIISDAKAEIEKKQIELEEKKKELEVGKSEYQKELDSYQNQLDDAKDYLKYISTSSWSASSLEESRDFNQYISDIKRVENISNYFPILFYIVSILVTITNITRIVESDREKIGLLKALGYKRNIIASSYYCFGLIATVLGSIIGCLIGFLLIPRIFYRIYLLIYNLPRFTYYFNFKIMLLASLLAIILVLVCIFISIRSTLKEKPVVLLRPKVSASGKRIIIERIPFIWNLFSFTSKVTLRNLFKYPKRFFMTIIGISGCIALIVSGFNLRSSISNVIPMQFGNIFDIDVQVFLRDSLTRNEIEEEKERINELDSVNQSILAYLKYAYINDSDSKVNMVIPEDNNLLTDFVTLKNDDDKYELGEGAILTEKIANMLNIHENDEIKIRDSENNVIKIKIDHIVDNYVDNYIYISKQVYEKLTDSSVKYNCLLLRLKDTLYNEADLSKKINMNNSVSYLTYTTTAKDMYDNVLLSLNYIVYVLVISAIILAFIVLYNLNSLNVFERRVEIATIKVLGFNKKETYKYIENEIKILVVISIIFGIIFGYFLSNILISSCELDLLMYDYSINYLNYLYAIIITIIFLIITSLISRKMIRNINMVESLKKNE